MKNEKILYFSISIKRLFIFSILSFGLYNVYWSYKNWVAIKKYKKENISPTLRSWFFYIIFIIPLLKRMKADLKTSIATEKNLSASIFFYVIFFFSQTFFEILLYSAKYLEIYLAYVFLSYIFLFLSVISLIPVQKAINAHNQTVKNLHDKRYYLDKTHTSEFLVTSYRHIIGYQDACKKNGYELQRYPLIFMQLFQNNLNKISNILAQNNLNIPQAWAVINPKIVIKINLDINKELEDMRKGLIIQSLADVSKTKAKQISWKDEYEDLMSIADVCLVLDNNAEFIISTNRYLKRYFYKRN